MQQSNAYYLFTSRNNHTSVFTNMAITTYDQIQQPRAIIEPQKRKITLGNTTVSRRAEKSNHTAKHGPREWNNLEQSATKSYQHQTTGQYILNNGKFLGQTKIPTDLIKNYTRCNYLKEKYIWKRTYETIELPKGDPKDDAYKGMTQFRDKDLYKCPYVGHKSPGPNKSSIA